MDLFKDKAYEELDEISQLVEPFEYKVNDELAQMPDEIELDNEFFASVVRNHGSRDTRKIVEQIASKLQLKNLHRHMRENYNFTQEFFKVEVEEGTQYDASTNILTGSAKVIKYKMAYEDKDIDEMLIKYMQKKFNNLPRPSHLKKTHINEICDLFGAKEALKDRSANGKIRFLYKRYKELMADRTLNIRDVDLFKRFVDWNVKYIVNGSLPSMSNITKVKIMMRSELPIYSIKEEIV